jgi:hypothetical protein
VNKSIALYLGYRMGDAVAIIGSLDCVVGEVTDKGDIKASILIAILLHSALDASNSGSAYILHLLSASQLRGYGLGSALTFPFVAAVVLLIFTKRRLPYKREQAPQIAESTQPAERPQANVEVRARAQPLHSCEDHGNPHRQTLAMVAGGQHLAECSCAHTAIYSDEAASLDTQASHSRDSQEHQSGMT